MAIWPETEFAVICGVFGAVWTFFLDPYNSLCFDRFSDPESRRQASRLVGVGYTLGYALSPFAGGVLFDLGGWSLCAYFQLTLCSVEAFFVWTSPMMWKDWQRHRHRSTKVSQPNGDMGHRAPDSRVILPREVRMPALMVALVAGLNIFLYNIEWCTFAVYFRQQFDWRSSWWAGAAQMSGDVVGALALVAAPRAKVLLNTSVPGNSGCPLLRLLQAPYHISVLYLAWAACFLGLASPYFALAVASQIAMGTVFVFTTQFVVEMNAMYAGDDFQIYLRLQWFSGTLFSIGAAFGAPAGLGLYEGVSRRAPFLVAVAIAVAGFAGYTGFFLVRVGLPMSFQDYEQKRGAIARNVLDPATDTSCRPHGEAPAASSTQSPEDLAPDLDLGELAHELQSSHSHDDEPDLGDVVAI